MPTKCKICYTTLHSGMDAEQSVKKILIPYPVKFIIIQNSCRFSISSEISKTKHEILRHFYISEKKIILKKY